MRHLASCCNRHGNHRHGEEETGAASLECLRCSPQSSHGFLQPRLHGPRASTWVHPIWGFRHQQQHYHPHCVYNLPHIWTTPKLWYSHCLTTPSSKLHCWWCAKLCWIPETGQKAASTEKIYHRSQRLRWYVSLWTGCFRDNGVHHKQLLFSVISKSRLPCICIFLIHN